MYATHRNALSVVFGRTGNSVQAKGNTALHYAIRYGFEEIVDALHSAGADDTLVNAFGLTPYEGLTPADLDLGAN